MPATTRPGQLRRRLTIEAPTTSRDEYGQNLQTWASVFTVWGQVVAVSGANVSLAGASTILTTAKYKITIRYRDDIRPGFHRIRYGTQGFEQLSHEGFDSMTTRMMEPMEMTGSTNDQTLFSISAALPDERHRYLVIDAEQIGNS